MKINDAFWADMENAVLCWLASGDGDGTPNVTPKEIFALHDEQTLVIADIMSANSVRNIRAHPQVCVSFVDVFRQRGFKVTGRAQVLSPDDTSFAAHAARLAEIAGPDFPIRNVVAVAIERVSRIWAPSYVLFPKRGEDERMAGAYKRYRVQPIVG